jgi:hypothetical protein
VAITFVGSKEGAAKADRGKKLNVNDSEDSKLLYVFVSILVVLLGW